MFFIMPSLQNFEFYVFYTEKILSSLMEFYQENYN